MKAKLKSISTSDFDPNNYWPEDEKYFGFYIEAEVGLDSSEGGDIFGFQICSPKWLEKNILNPTLMHGYIVVQRYDFLEIESFISCLCNRQSGESWEEIALKLASFSHWEYSDYTA